MAWWRRDSSWLHMPINRYAYRTLRDRESILRTRCFSKSNPKLASHKDDDGKRPSGFTDHEWAQLQLYRKWRQRFEDDPYKALFGASESMLSGKGLKEWRWFNNLKTFPEWIVKEMGLEDAEEKGRYSMSNSKGKRKDSSAQKVDRNDRDTSTTNEYPNRVNSSTLKEHETLDPEPSLRSTKTERDPWSSGIDSPSDSRRLRDQNNSFPSEKSTLETVNDEKMSFEEQIKDSVSDIQTASSKAPQTPIIDKASGTATTRETSFIDEFLADSPQPSNSSSEWRQTTLDRRALADNPIPRRKTNIPVIDVTMSKPPSTKPQKTTEEPNSSNVKETKFPEHIEELETYREANPNHLDHLRPKTNAPSTLRHEPESLPVLNDSVPNVDEVSNDKSEDWSYVVDREHPRDRISSLEQATSAYEKNRRKASEDAEAKSNKGDEWMKEPEKQTKGDADPQTTSPTSKSRIQSLDKLPEDDLDFLSAENVRASMGRVKNRQTSHDRQKLEEQFNAAANQHDELHPMIEAKIKNDQLIRRTEREMRKDNQHESSPISPSASEPSKGSALNPTETSYTPLPSARPVSILETGIDFMIRWLHTGGDILSRSFFQDPVDVLADQTRLQEGISSDPFFKGIVSGVQKGRLATRQIKFDLERDIPAAKMLIERLNNNERNVVRTAGIISGTVIQTSRDRMEQSTEERIRVLKRGLLATDEEFKTACQAVDDVSSTTKNSPPSEALSRRLRIAADVLRKNAKLTRVMIFGLQTRLEASKDRPSQLSRGLAHRLLALQDTQLALLRVVSRRMHVLGIKPEAEEERIWKGPLQSNTIAEDEGQSTAAINKRSFEADSSPTKVTEDQVEEMRKRYRTALANAKFAAEVEETKKTIEGLYSREPKSSPTPEPLPKKRVLDTNSPLVHSLFRPFGQQLESLKTEVSEEVKKEVVEEQKEKDEELVREVRSAYEDVYGPITVEHRQIEGGEETAAKELVGESDANARETVVETVPAAATIPEAKQEKLRGSHQLLKEDEISPTISTTPVTSSTTEAEAEVETPPPFAFPATSTASPTRPPSTPNYEYRIYTHDPTTDTLLITPYPCPSPSPDSTPDTTIPPHTALPTLSHPSKFLPHLPLQYDIIAVAPEMMIIRSVPREGEACISEPIFIPFPSASTPTSTTPPSPSSSPSPTATAKSEEDTGSEIESESEKDTDTTIPTTPPEITNRTKINPIDGTTHLSPTGFVGTSINFASDSDFEERRAAAAGVVHRGSKATTTTTTTTKAKATTQSNEVDMDDEDENATRGAYVENGNGKGKGKRRKGKGEGRSLGGIIKGAVKGGVWIYIGWLAAELYR